ncbi:hypothetical protein ACH5RR_007456 [Cinchona calisaya]|uniref:J domain-containing protein n=1 Tax=Cinchona calisaya TaxID=153742 RepID=A0ABD3ARX2_9GENT
MNRIRIAAIINFEANPFQQRVCFIHSTPILERKRRSHWDSGGGSHWGSRRSYKESRFNSYSKRNRKINAKQELLRNVSSFAEHLFQSWKFDRDDCDPYESRSSSWFRQDFKGDGFKKGKSRNKRQQAWNTRFQFFVEDDDFEVETIFKSAFGGNGYSYFSFINEEPPWRDSSRHTNNHRFYWNWGREYEEEDDSSSESDSLKSDLTSDRLALGLSSSGTLSLEDVKNAYRACALKWHPDRHHGSSKVVAEEKFKHCSAAYQSLCDKLALN